MSDSPLIVTRQENSEEKRVENDRSVPEFDEKHDESPIIAGRILVYDIDEEPPLTERDRFRQSGRSLLFSFLSFFFNFSL